MNETTPKIRERPADAFHDARMTGIPSRPVASWSLAMGLGGLFLGFVGATDSYQYPLVLRLGFWLGLCAVAGIIAITIEAALARFGLRSRVLVLWWAALTLGLATAMLPVIFLVNSTGAYSPIADLPIFALNSIAISGALTALRLAIGALLPGGVTEQDEATTAPGLTPTILARLAPARRTSRLLALKSEGHYLKVYTDQGSELVLMRLKDAIAESAPVEGMQVHRSWWIARAAVLDQRRREGRTELKLDEETWVPVSRTYAATWREAGW